MNSFVQRSKLRNLATEVAYLEVDDTCRPFRRVLKRIMRREMLLICCAFILVNQPKALGGPIASASTPYVRWRNGPPPDETFSSIAVWLQPPEKAKRYVAAGFNTYVGLWNGPTEEQLVALKRTGMKVFCEQKPV